MATQISYVSSKYKDFISKSILISSGPPDVYQLRPKEEKTETLTRKTVGEKNLNKTNKTILLVGETGTGKSTLINTLVNYTMGVKFEDNIWFKIVEEEKKSQSESQTSDVIMYEIFGFEGETLPFSLTIINTPGYGDTRGIEKDVIVNERLLDLFRSDEGVHVLDAVGLVMKATENRLSDRLKYIFDSVVSLFGKDIEEKIVALITHSDGRRPKNALKALEAANIKCAKNEKNQPVHFLFDNCLDDARVEDEIEELECSYEITLKGFRQLTGFIGKTAPQELGTTLEVLNARVELTICINNLQEIIKLIELKKTEIRQTKEALKKLELESDERTTVEVDEGVDQGAVCCDVCEENFHYPCTLAWSPRGCKIMKIDHCTVCTNKCHVSKHVKENQRYVNKTRRVKKTKKELKQKYELEHQETKDVLRSLERETEKFDQQKNLWLDEAYEYVIRLQQIALNAHSVSTHVHLDFLIEKMKERGDMRKMQKLEEIKSREDKGTKKVLGYLLGRLKSATGKANS